MELRKYNEVITLRDAERLVEDIAEEMFLTNEEKKLLMSIPLSCQRVSTEKGEVILFSDLEGLVKNVSQAIKFRDSSFLRQPRGLSVSRVVGVQEFVESKEFMGQGSSCRPAVMDALTEIFDSPRSNGYIECVLTGSVGWGKTYCANLAIAYMLYKLSCFHSPQAEYDLAPGTSIVFIMQSKREQLSKKVVFEQFAGMLEESRYFKEFFPWDKGLKSELRFPKGIHVIPVGGSDTSAIGMNVFGGVIDEMNFMSVVRDSERSVGTESMVYDQAERIYTTVIRRMKTRFIQKGSLPGKLFLVSSSNYPGDFTSKKIEEAKTNSSIFCVSHSLWDVLPKDRLSGEKFFVEVGNEVKQSRILKSIEEAIDIEDVLEVPVDFKPEFERNLTDALRDYAGVTTGSSYPFIPYKELIAKAQEDYLTAGEGKTLFTRQEVVINYLSKDGFPDWEKIVDLSYIEECITDKTVPFVMHIDAAVSEDAAGVAIGRIYGYKLLPSTKFFNPKVKEFVEVKDIRAPIYMIDGVLRVIPPPDGGQIDLELVRDLGVWLAGKVYLKWVTMDSYQSTMMIQSFRKRGIRSGVLSVDTSMAPYTELKLAIKDERILFPPHNALARELREVEKNREKDKIEHPSKGSKDCSDAVAGVVYMLLTKEASLGGSSRRSTRNSIREVVPPPEDGIRAIHLSRRRSRRF